MINQIDLNETVQILMEFFILPELYSDRMANLSHPVGLVPKDFSELMDRKMFSKDSTPYEGKGSGIFINFTALTSFAIEKLADNEDW